MKIQMCAKKKLENAFLKIVFQFVTIRKMYKSSNNYLKVKGNCLTIISS